MLSSATWKTLNCFVIFCNHVLSVLMSKEQQVNRVNRERDKNDIDVSVQRQNGR